MNATQLTHLSPTPRESPPLNGQNTVGRALPVDAEVNWIVANFKEHQLAHMQAGQTVEITVDAVAGHRFVGTVESFSPGKGAKCSLLPPDNATGNFTKIVQRVPVKSASRPRACAATRTGFLPVCPPWSRCASNAEARGYLASLCHVYQS